MRRLSEADLAQVEVERVVKVTDKAMLVLVEGEEVWLPISQIHEDSEVENEGDSGTLVIPLWLAEEKGLV